MFKIGQKVVCIKTHSQKCVIKGKIYTITNVIQCSCGLFSVSTDHYEHHTGLMICDCNRRHTGTYFGHELFRPLNYNLISNKELIKESIPEKLDTPIKEPEKA